MVVFLVLGLISSSALLYTAVNIKMNERDMAKPLSALLTAIAGAACVAIIAFKVNNPANLITILAKPTTGLSGAVISQIVLLVTGLIVYFKKPQSKTAYIVLMCLFIYSVFCLNRLYMISTRSALNTYLLTFVFASVSVFAAGSFIDEESKRAKAINLGLSLAASLILIAFFVRMAFVSPPDRIMPVTMLVQGDLAFVFWAFILLGIALPLVSSVNSFFKLVKIPTAVLGISTVVALLLLSIIINQMPAHLDAVQGRMLF